MSRFPAILVLLIAGFVSDTVLACPRMTPYYAALTEYKSVFVGRVTGTYLAGYEDHLLGKPDFVVTIHSITITDSSELVKVRAVVTRTIRGTSPRAVELSLAGCTFDPPKLKSEAIFFVLPNGTAIVVSREEGEAAYQAWLGRLGVAPNER